MGIKLTTTKIKKPKWYFALFEKTKIQKGKKNPFILHYYFFLKDFYGIRLSPVLIFRNSIFGPRLNKNHIWFLIFFIKKMLKLSYFVLARLFKNSSFFFTICVFCLCSFCVFRCASDCKHERVGNNAHQSYFECFILYSINYNLLRIFFNKIINFFNKKIDTWHTTLNRN